MASAVEVLTGFVTAPGSTITAVTMAAGNTLTVRNAAPESKISLLDMWVDSQLTGVVRLRSPQLHDNVQGIRLRHVASEVDPLLSRAFTQMLKSQDLLTLELSGSAVVGDIETVSLLVHYSDLPGINGRFIDVEALRTRGQHIVGVENTLALGVAGGYSGEEAINADFSLLRANTDYAIVGYLVDTECATIRYRGVDFGNLGVGGPGNEIDKFVTSRWFEDLSRAYGMPLIPVFNSANVAGLLVDGAQDENGADVNLTTLLVELSPA